MFSSYYMDRRGYVHPNQIDQDDVRVVVISPEDREQVERLAAAIADTSAVKVPWSERGDTNRAIAVSGVQTALREFANPTPTRPEEPTGLGAVVENDRGRLFVREHDGWWRGEEPCTLNWAAVHAVRVLSEGVQP